MTLKGAGREDGILSAWKGLKGERAESTEIIALVKELMKFPLKKLYRE